MDDLSDIYREYALPVYKYLCTLTGDGQLAEELTQEVFYQAVRSIHRYNGECTLLVWLCQIGKHRYYDYLKKEKRRSPGPIGEDFPAVAPAEDPQLALEAKDGMLRLYSAIHALDEPQREVVLLRILGDLSFKEIGQIMGKSENWARVNFYRAKLKLAKGEEDG